MNEHHRRGSCLLERNAERKFIWCAHFVQVVKYNGNKRNNKFPVLMATEWNREWMLKQYKWVFGLVKYDVVVSLLH